MADERPICPKCNAPVIKGCDGQGYILVNKGGEDPERPWFNPEHVRQCDNLYARQLADHLGPELAKIRYVTESPLLRIGPEGVEYDLTKSNLLIGGCPWHNLKPHLKWALGKRRPGFNPLLFFWLILTDENLKDIWVGNKQYKALSLEKREEVKTYNALGDLLEGRDLIIIKLGYFGQRNRAAPGILKEALLIREAQGKPTWLVHDPKRRWDISFNPDVAEYVKENFKGVKIEPTADPGVETPTDIVVDDDDGEDEVTAEIMAELEEDWEEYRQEDDTDVDVSDIAGPMGASTPRWKR